ncbi:MAG: hypothetical protein DWQ05_10950 [Calditrichaeota bacterium]|nr:MAG: hypothetical protein DWQ05_10950 [Calditrichota bacterium]
MKWLLRILKHTLFKETFITFIDQALLSAANFTINLLLIRNAVPSEYGAYALAFSTILLFVGVQNALITTPMTVLGPKKNPEDRQRFAGQLFVGQYLIWLPIIFFIFIASELLSKIGLSRLEISVVQIVCATVLIVLMREFFRRLFFHYLRPKSVLLIDFIYASAFISFILIAIDKFEISAILALSAMFGACLIIVPVALLISHKKLNIRLQFRPGVLKETWVHGRFAIMGVLFTWIHNRAFLFLLSGIKDKAAVADIDSIRLVFMPVQIVMTSISSILKPRGAAILASNDKKKFFKISAYYMFLTCSGAVFYIAAMLLTFDYFAFAVFNREIADSNQILTLWGIKFGLHACMLILTVAYQVMEQFKSLFRIGAVAAIVSIISTWFGIHYWNAPGSLLGPIAGELCFILLLIYFARIQIAKGLRSFEFR